MADATQLIQAMAHGDSGAAAQLMPLIYNELRKLAARQMSQEQSALTLQPTALVHEAYLRLVNVPHPQEFDGRNHFFAAAAEAMRRILIEEARRRNALKRGGNRAREGLDLDQLAHLGNGRPADDLLALDEALTTLAAEDPSKADLVKLRYFAGLTLAQASDVLGISHNTADAWWAYAKAFLYHAMTSGYTD